MTFGQRLREAIESRGQLCVGIDPHPFLLKDWGLSDDAPGLREFGLRVVEASGSRVAVVKPQVAFFERHGSAGFAALEDVLRAAREAGLIVIGDAKRGDIGSTFEGYAEAWLAPGAPLEVDAITVSPYLGVGSIDGAHMIAAAHGKGLFVLSATSNPEARGLQLAITPGGATVAASIVERVQQWNADENPVGLGSTGLVLGASVDLAAYGIGDLAGIPVLAPGFGHQGARIADLRAIYGAAAGNVLVSASRSILGAGPDGIAETISAHADEIAEALAA